MKIRLYSSILLTVGFVLLTVAIIGTSRDFTCNTGGWTTKFLQLGLFCIALATFLLLYIKDRTFWWFGILAGIGSAIVLGLIVVIIAFATAPGGILHCYSF